MEYKVSWPHPQNHFIDIEYIIDGISEETTEVQLPAWRPGRYELAGYHKNIRTFQVFDSQNFPLQFRKIKKDRWKIECKDTSKIKIRYSYYASQMDAGGSWVDEELIYLNFINFLLYIPGRETEACSVQMNLPETWKTACGISFKNGILHADDFYHIVDNPFLASENLKHHSFHIEGVEFNLWFYGEVSPVWNILEKKFAGFAKEQINTMGEFPEKDYHFLFLILPYRHYHGVEHRNSTVIVLGPADKFHEKDFQDNLLGISSHELFHAWNIIKIRPKEMMPYDFSQENYYRTGYVAEGFTTFYGDLFLYRSKVFSEEEYLKELNLMLKRHFDNFGRYNMSVTDSSYDLWIDGYTAGIPNRKVSIYVKGAIIAWMLNLEIEKSSQGKKNLDDVMRVLWKEFGKKGKGYSEEDIKWICSELAGKDLTDFFENFVEGTEDEEEKLKNLINSTPWKLEKSENSLTGERSFGFRVSVKEGRTEVDSAHPGSPGDLLLVKDDEIISVDGIKVTGNLHELLKDKKETNLVIFRNLRMREIFLMSNGGSYYPVFRVVKK